MKDVLRLCESRGIICLQEHWLLPSELGMLNNIHSDFLGIGCSAVDVTGSILVGRPFGGTAILYKKPLSNNVNVMSFSNWRISGLRIDTTSGPLLLLTVYMPTEYNDDESLEKYIATCANLEVIITDSDVPHYSDNWRF